MWDRVEREIEYGEDGEGGVAEDSRTEDIANN
jgi:hypothetical protein